MKRKSGKSSMKWKYMILTGVTTTIIGLDQLTKYWVVERFRLGESLSILPKFFNLTYVQNKGAAFGLLAQAHPAFRVPFFIVVPILALLSIAYVFKKIADNDIKMSLALSLVISGAIGNLIDRVVRGFVVDFLDFHWNWIYHFPAFNVADSAICVGVGILMVDLLVQEVPVSPKKGSTANASNSR
jgi:signal peptidase II